MKHRRGKKKGNRTNTILNNHGCAILSRAVHEMCMGQTSMEATEWESLVSGNSQQHSCGYIGPNICEPPPSSAKGSTQCWRWGYPLKPRRHTASQRWCGLPSCQSTCMLQAPAAKRQDSSHWNLINLIPAFDVLPYKWPEPYFSHSVQLLNELETIRLSISTLKLFPGSDTYFFTISDFIFVRSLIPFWAGKIYPSGVLAAPQYDFTNAFVSLQLSPLTIHPKWSAVVNCWHSLYGTKIPQKIYCKCSR